MSKAIKTQKYGLQALKHQLTQLFSRTKPKEESIVDAYKSKLFEILEYVKMLETPPKLSRDQIAGSLLLIAHEGISLDETPKNLLKVIQERSKDGIKPYLDAS